MGFSKSFYSQFGEEIANEVRVYKAHEERAVLSSKPCQHKDVRFENGELRCRCGVAWGGGRLDELYKFLKRR